MAGGDGSITRVSRKASSKVVVTEHEVATDGLVMAKFDAFSIYIYHLNSHQIIYLLSTTIDFDIF